MINIQKERCCGCGACEQICPQKCIIMQEDVEGFLYPEINHSKCINCHLCESSCPVFITRQEEKELKVFAAYNKDETIRLNSSSGGIFSLLAEWVISQKGVVFGAVFDENWMVHHVAIESLDELCRLRGSKYLQSRTENTYTEAKRYLTDGRKVLYTGTPCEIEGLKSYLNKEYGNLYTQDIICHGTPSPKLWNKYITYREETAGSTAKTISFRHKNIRHKTYSVRFEFLNDSIYEENAAKDIFMQMYLQNLCMRPSCYECSFKKINRRSDLTLADFWGCDEFCPGMDGGKGCSLVAIHSPKGAELLDIIKDKIIYKEIDQAQAFTYNPSITNSASKPEFRDEFMSKIDAEKIENLAKNYLQHRTLKSKIFGIIPINWKRKLVKLLKK